MQAIVVRVALVLFIVAAAQPAPVARGGEPKCCAHCGCQCRLKPVCRIVCDKKEVKETVYECQCEDFCVPGPSKPAGCYCDTDPNCPCHAEQKPIYKPCWCDMFHRKKLTKKEVTKEVPVYKCVVEYVCADCCNRCGDGYSATLHVEPDGQSQALMPLPPGPMMSGERPQSVEDTPPDARSASVRRLPTASEVDNPQPQRPAKSLMWLLRN
jgi:hypothetical protein